MNTRLHLLDTATGEWREYYRNQWGHLIHNAITAAQVADLPERGRTYEHALRQRRLFIEKTLTA